MMMSKLLVSAIKTSRGHFSEHAHPCRGNRSRNGVDDLWTRTAGASPMRRFCGLVGNRVKLAVSTEVFENPRTDAEIAAVQPQIAGLDSLLDPRKRHQIGQRQADGF